MSRQHVQCVEDTVVSQLIKARTKVTIEPIINEGIPRIYCLDSSVRPIRGCDGRQSTAHDLGECHEPSDKCTFMLTQLLCVEIPINCGVDVGVDQGSVQCSRPWIGLCDAMTDEASIIDEESEY